MNNFTKLYEQILEEEEGDIFKASTPEEGLKRKEEWAKIKIKELADSGKAKLNEDDSYDIYGDVDLFSMGLTQLPVKFNKVDGNFNCHANNLTTLKGAPREVGGNFLCHANNLTSLEGGPTTVGQGFYCHSNKLTTLEGGPKAVGENFYCTYNKLTTLKGAPKEVGKYFDCAYNDKKFTTDDVRAVCDVKGQIYV